MRTPAGYDLLQGHRDLHPAVVDIESQGHEYGVRTVEVSLRQSRMYPVARRLCPLVGHRWVDDGRVGRVCTRCWWWDPEHRA